MNRVHPSNHVAFESLETRQLMSGSPGAYDMSFSFDGVATSAVSGYSAKTIGAVVQSDGKVVVASLSSDPDHIFGPQAMDLVLTRFAANGQIDLSFGKSGRTEITGQGGDFLDAYR